MHNHDSTPVLPTDTFFAPAPPEIGALRSGTSSAREHDPPPGWSGTRITLVVCLGILTLIFGGLLTALVGLAPDLESWLLSTGAVIVAVEALVIWHTRPWESCTYAGEDGLARIERRGGRRRQSILRFADAAWLRISATHVHLAHNYLFTNRVYDWGDDEGRIAFRIWVRSNERRPKRLPTWHPAHFAAAALHAWEPHAARLDPQRVCAAEERIAARVRHARRRLLWGLVLLPVCYLLVSLPAAWYDAEDFNAHNARAQALMQRAEAEAQRIQAVDPSGLPALAEACAEALEPGHPGSLLVLSWPPARSRDFQSPPTLFGRPADPTSEYSDTLRYDTLQAHAVTLGLADRWSDVICRAPWSWFRSHFADYRPEVDRARYLAVAAAWRDARAEILSVSVIDAGSGEPICAGSSRIIPRHGQPPPDQAVEGACAQIAPDFGLDMRINRTVIRVLCRAGGEALCDEAGRIH
ncbi:MAG: hypothetical protein JXR96_17855 [Deltaproteobacteria bacterium]|nr:hypothetical protein [Deltaproteobacteria bacterium]